jgi:hypothetical protein
MKSIFTTAAGITTMWGLAAFAIAAILYFARGARKTPGWIAIAAIVILVLIPTVSWVRLEGSKADTSSIYHLRVTVLDPSQTPVEDARVWSSIGGEPKKVAGGWQFDIPAATKLADGKVTVYATIENAFLRGSSQVQLAGEFYPNATVQLQKDASARVRGMVQDQTGAAVAGAQVNIVGSPVDEIAVTGKDGNFELPAHAARDQQVELHAEKRGYKAVNEWHPAGDTPATLVLQNSSRR